VSGPGALSRRTDGGPSQPVERLPDAGYGESKAFEEQQAGAPVSASAAVVDPSGIVPLDAPTTRPNEAVTTGMTSGVEPMVPDEDDIQRFRSYLGPLKAIASRPGASSATRQFVRQLEQRLQES
jgi:hypothetical protein